MIFFSHFATFNPPTMKNGRCQNEQRVINVTDFRIYGIEFYINVTDFYKYANGFRKIHCGFCHLRVI